MTPVELVLSRLSGAKRNGTGWSARCPAHDDRAPSLSVGAGDDGRALICCHAGCSAEAVVQALDLTLQDLMPAAVGDCAPRYRLPKPASASPTPPPPRSDSAACAAGVKTFSTAEDAIADLEN